MKVPNKRKAGFVDEFKRLVEQLPEDEPCVRRMRGNPDAKALLIAPVPNEEDVKMDLPFSNDGWAKSFHVNLQKETGLNTETDFLVMCGSPFPKRATKKNTEPFKDLVIRHASQFNLIVMIGGDHFKFMFGAGKKSSLNTLASGTLIYLPKMLGDTPVFVFPEISALNPVYNDDENDWKLRVDEEKCLKWLYTLFPKLNTHLTKLLKQ